MVELEDFKYGGTNITALRLVDPAKEKVNNNKQTNFFRYQRLKLYLNKNLLNFLDTFQFN